MKQFFSYVGLGLLLFIIGFLVESGFTGIGVRGRSSIGIPLFVLIEEAVKLFPLWKCKGIVVWKYLLIVATVFTLFEYFGTGFKPHEILTIGGIVRILPHYLFAGLYLWSAKEGKFFGFLVAANGHLYWNLFIPSF